MKMYKVKCTGTGFYYHLKYSFNTVLLLLVYNVSIHFLKPLSTFTLKCMMV
jgi:hypothetical protein